MPSTNRLKGDDRVRCSLVKYRIAVATAAALGGISLLVGCGGVTQSHTVSVPADATASPTSVARAFFTAQAANDESAQVSLATAHFGTILRQTTTPLMFSGTTTMRFGVDPVSDVRIGPAAAERSGQTFVPVHFVSKGVTFPWGYTVVRDAATGKWLVADQGSI